MGEVKVFASDDVRGKRVIVRVDFNVPIRDGVVADDTRIRAAFPTIEALLEAQAAVILMSHLGRPAGTGYEEAFSLAPVAAKLADYPGMQGHDVIFATDTIGPDAKAKAASLVPGQVLLLENLRFDKREKKNDPEFARELASLAEVYVNDAFGTAHRAHASTAGITAYLPSYAGFLLEREVRTLTDMLDAPDRPFVAVLGGSKVSDKIKVITALIDKCDTLIIGGGMCFTFLAAKGYGIGKSLVELDWIDAAKDMLAKAEEKGVALLLPVDVVVADRFAADAEARIVAADAIPEDMMGLDVGPETSLAFAVAINGAKTVFWNGPMGVFEFDRFAGGTLAVAQAMAGISWRKADTIVGGGDSVAAVNKFGVAKSMHFISTGGGASMELVQGEALPGVEALRKGE